MLLPIAEVIAIGDELTTGQRLDTNSRWLSERLTELGVRVVYHTTVADDLESNVAVFRAAIERADVIVATGGLGPTADDLTRQAIAAAVGVELHRDDEALAHIRHLFESRGRLMPKRNVVQAMIPDGSHAISNPSGTAPGIHMEVPRRDRSPCRLFALPGVPGEMFGMWDATVVPAIRAVHAQPCMIRHRRIHCFGAGESHIEAMLPDMIRRGRDPLVGITASSATITLRITSSGSDEQACLNAMEPTIGKIREALGTLVFGEENDQLQDAVVRLLKQQGKSVATAEWATSGLMAQWLSEADDDGASFVGGTVIHGAMGYTKLLLATDATLDDGGDELTTAKRMAQSVQSQSGAAYGLAVSGVTSAGKFAVALVTEGELRSRSFAQWGDAKFAKIYTAKVALNYLRLALLQNET